jgi:phosphoribosylanthranilate isomerase
MTWVKICGTTSWADALVAVEAGADALGFVFYEKSPRCVTPEATREIVKKLPAGIETVGVFLDEAPERVVEIADFVDLSAVQLHGYQRKWPVTERKVFVAAPVGELLRLVADMPSNLSAIFADASAGKGQMFDWDEAWTSVQAAAQFFPVAVAGGLTPENVAGMMAVLEPWGVDVVSGVELVPGKKDPEKVKAFVGAVRGAERKRRRSRKDYLESGEAQSPALSLARQGRGTRPRFLGKRGGLGRMGDGMCPRP